MTLENVAGQLANIQALLTQLVERQQVREWYTTQEFGRLVGRAAYTVREYCRRGLLQAQKRPSGRTAGQWVISAGELERFQRDGLLPVQEQN